VSETPIALAGRRQELAALAAALKVRQSRLITGPAGIGKTRLLEEALAQAGEPVALVSRPAALHGLLASLAGQIGCRSSRFADLRRATTIHLKPLVLNALGADPRPVVLDGMEDVEPRMYRFLQELSYVPRTCLVAAVRSRGGMGYLGRLFWNPDDEVALQPLTRAESLSLFEQASQACGLGAFDVDGFRHKALDAARGNPGRILGLCRMAARPEYRRGRYIKFAPLRIDYLSAFE
jgi:hypothetical protein